MVCESGCNECAHLREQIEKLQKELMAKDLVINNNFQENPIYDEDEGLTFVLNKRACEDLYYEAFGGNKKPFTDEEWQLVLDRFNECIATESNFANGDFDMLKHYARDTMWYVLGFPVCVLFYRGEFYQYPIRRIDVRIPVGYDFQVSSITTEHIAEALWEKEKDKWLKENGWCKHEINFKFLTASYADADDDLEDYAGEFFHLNLRHRQKYLEVNAEKKGNFIEPDDEGIWETIITQPIQLYLINSFCDCEQEESEDGETDEELADDE